MKKVLFFFLLIWNSVNPGQAQEIYVDPALSAATYFHANTVERNLAATNGNLTAIQKAQLLVTGQLTIINRLQDNIYKGLTEVSTIIKNTLTIKDVAEISLDIVGDINKAAQLAKSDPLLLLFAEQNARDFKTRAIALSTEVSSFVLQGGQANMMDAGERSKILYKIKQELTILRGLAYGMHRSIYWAKKRGVWNSLNPYQGFINRDKQIAQEIFNNSKILKK